MQRLSVGASIVSNPLDVGTSPTFLVLDSVEPSGVREAVAKADRPGQWSAAEPKVEGAIYRHPDATAPRLLSFPGFSGPELRATYTTYEHPSPMPPPSPLPLVAVNVELPSPVQPGEAFEVVVVGAWASVSLPNPLPPPPIPAPTITVLAFNVPYGDFRSFTGGSLVKITSEDVVTVLRYQGGARPGSGVLTGQRTVPPFEQTSDPTMATGKMAAVTPATDFSAAIAPATVANRFASQTPPPTTTAALNWRVQAAPGYSVGFPTGISLANGPIEMADTSVSGTFANPFPNQWHPVLTYRAQAQRTVNIGGAVATMTTSLQSIVEANTGLTLDLPTGLPTMIAVNGTPLNSDGMTVSLDVSKPVYIDITADRTNNTIYEVNVMEVSVVGTAVTQTSVAVVTGVAPHLPLPPRTLQTGHTYSVRATVTTGGYPNAASGDLQTFALPVTHGYLEGAVFNVAAP